MSDQIVQRSSGPVRSLLRAGMGAVSALFPKTSTVKQTVHNGGPLLVWANEYIGRRILTTGSFETDALSFLKSVVRAGDTCIDVGANIGIYSLAFSRLVGPSGKVEAFEPVTRNALLTELNCELNELRNVRVVRAPLSDSSGKNLSRHTPQSDSAYSYFSADGEPGDTPPSLSLDDYLGQRAISRVDFIKIDVEGAELSVLRGGAGLLASRGRPRIIMIEMVDEYLGRFGDSVLTACTWLEQFGYVPHELRNGQLVQIDPSEIEIQNVFFTERRTAP